MKEETWNAIKNGKKPWKTEEWKEKREEILDKKGRICEWCGSKENICIHHPSESYPKAQNFNKLAYKFFLKSDRYKSLLEKDSSKYKEICPECGKGTIYKRKTKTPKWRCSNCNNTFTKPDKKQKMTKRVDKKIFRKHLQIFKNSNEEKIEKIRKKKFKESMQEYFEMNSVKVLCKSCHNAIENDKTLCSKCGKNYHSKRYNVCQKCNSG